MVVIPNPKAKWRLWEILIWLAISYVNKGSTWGLSSGFEPRQESWVFAPLFPLMRFCSHSIDTSDSFKNSTSVANTNTHKLLLLWSSSGMLNNFVEFVGFLWFRITTCCLLVLSLTLMPWSFLVVCLCELLCWRVSTEDADKLLFCDKS